MSRSSIALALACWCISSAAGVTAPTVRAEIDALLGKLQASGCQFNRNGSWHTGAEAKGHLIRKLEYLEDKGTVASAEQFVELAASRSSSSGKPYLVRCGSEAPVESRQWLGRELSALRAAAAKAKP